MKTTLGIAVTTLVLVLAAGPAQSGPGASVAGEKIDSGLGDLPHYSQWADRYKRDSTGYRVVGESLDDGLGELPHYSKWSDPSGRNPLQGTPTRVAENRR